MILAYYAKVDKIFFITQHVTLMFHCFLLNHLHLWSRSLCLQAYPISIYKLFPSSVFKPNGIPNVLVYFLKNPIYNNTLFLCCLNLLFKDIWYVWLSGQNMTVLKSSISNSYDFLHILRYLWQKLQTVVDRVAD